MPRGQEAQYHSDMVYWWLRSTADLEAGQAWLQAPTLPPVPPPAHARWGASRRHRQLADWGPRLMARFFLFQLVWTLTTATPVRDHPAPPAQEFGGHPTFELSALFWALAVTLGLLGYLRQWPHGTHARLPQEDKCISAGVLIYTRSHPASPDSWVRADAIRQGMQVQVVLPGYGGSPAQAP